VTWTTGAYTHNIQDGAVSPSEWPNSPSPYGYERGAGALGAPVLTLVPTTTLTALLNVATPATYSAITAVPIVAETGAMAGRIAIKVNATSWTGTTPVLEVIWLPLSIGGAGNMLHADAADTFATLTAGNLIVIKELAVKAPAFVLALTSGTPGSEVFTADVTATAT
jgi:hypothetical protein